VKPLNSAATSKWSTFFRDNEILEQIDKDVRRTNPDLAWFQTPVPPSSLSPLSPPPRSLTSRSSFDSLRLASPLLVPHAGTPPSVHGASSVPRASVIPRSARGSPALRPAKSPASRPLSPASRPCSAGGYPDVPSRRSLFRRIAHLNSSFGARERSISAQGTILGDDELENDLHWEAIERLLFIYAKLNPAISYVQGMNELIAPLYYVPPQLL
jgi:hypothetical protein